MTRSGKELKGFLGAVELLLDDQAWLSWVDGAGPHRPVSREVRRDLADFLAVVGGDGRFRGTQLGKLELIGDGSGWAAPAAKPGVDRVWHAIKAEPGLRPRPVCGPGEVDWGLAERVVEVVSGVRWCTHRACQVRIEL